MLGTDPIWCITECARGPDLLRLTFLVFIVENTTMTDRGLDSLYVGEWIRDVKQMKDGQKILAEFLYL